MQQVDLIFVLVARWPVVEDTWVFVPVFAPTAGMHDGVVGHAGIRRAGVAARKVIRIRMTRRDVIRMVGRESRPDVGWQRSVDDHWRFRFRRPEEE